MAAITNELRNDVLDILVDVCESEDVKDNPDIRLFDEGLLDSFGTISLLVEFEKRLGVEVPISDFNRDEWATPNMIVRQLAERK
ncbi:D-alanine--poly(phosphoribitol) ligase subunit 2 [Terrilactibacillus sp. S3-3]|nr:D-alanine--poly(phosphoribitol) ligase subunit 2 [Terrilactibacillus sp. S3-3]